MAGIYSAWHHREQIIEIQNTLYSESQAHCNSRMWCGGYAPTLAYSNKQHC